MEVDRSQPTAATAAALPHTAAAAPTSAHSLPPRRTHRTLIATAIVLIILVAAGLWAYGRRGTALSYITVAASLGTVAPSVTASGTVNPVVTIQVGTYVSGVIQQLYCDFNTAVHKRQLCAKIDPNPYQVLVDQAQANLASARAQRQKDEAGLQLARVTYERFQGLLDQHYVSKADMDTASGAYQQALAQIKLDEAAIQQHQAALKASQVNLEYTNILSPVDGTVVSRNVTQGQTVAASFQTPTLFIIATDLTKMQVDASVSEADIGAVALGNAATFTVEAYPSRRFPGRVVQVRQAPQTVQNVVTYDVVIEVANPELLLKPGMTAAARITTQRHDNVLRVAEAALRYVPSAQSTGPKERSGASSVWILRGNTPVAVAVEVGLSDEANAEIVHGELAAGDLLIVAERSSDSTASARVPGPSTVRAPRL